MSKYRWEVKWSDDRTPAQALVDRLLTDPELAHEVYNKLRGKLYNPKTGKRRSVA